MLARRSVALIAGASLLAAACSSDDSADDSSTDDSGTAAADVESGADDDGDGEVGVAEDAGDGDGASDADDAESDDAAGDDEASDDAGAGDGDEDDVPADEEEPPAPEDPAISGTPVTVTPSENAPLTAVVATSWNAPVQVEVTATSGDHVVEVPRTAAAEEEHQVPLVGMRPDQTYSVSVEMFDSAGESVFTGDGEEVTTPPLPDYYGDHQLTIDADRAAPGYTIVEFDRLGQELPEGALSSQHLVAYDNDGEIVWTYENTGALAGFEVTPAGTFNIFYWPFGTREVDFLGNVVGNWRPLPNGADPSVIQNETLFEGIDPEQVQFQGGLAALAGRPGDAEPVPIVAPWVELDTIHHEAWPMPNGNTLTLSTTIHELTPEQRETFCPGDPAPFNAISDVAVEFQPDGTVVRTWDLWDAIDIDEFPGHELCVPAGIFAEENSRDWNHANSVTYDPERDAVIISSRHTDQIVAFDHLDDEGPQTSVRWILGAGSTMPLEGEPTYFQHAVEVNPDGSIIVYDNGNSRPGTEPLDAASPPSACTSSINCTGAYSRAVIYDVDDSSDDPAEWSATQRWEHIDTAPDGDQLVYAAFISDADVLSNGNVLVTHGGIGSFPPNPEDPLNILIREVVPEGDSGGEIVWELQGDDGFVTYRSERIESFYNGDDWIPRDT